MNTFWLKIAGLAVIVVGAIFLISVFLPGTDSEPKEPEKTFYDQAQQDKEKFLSKPEPLSGQQAKSDTAQQPTVTRPVQPKPTQSAVPTTLYFKELGEIDKIEAERLLNVAVPGFSIGRLPMTGYKQLNVDLCRRIIRRWPDSYYAYQAKRMLANLPPRYQTRYRITKEEMDISRFTKPRPGTKPFTIKESR